MRVVVAAAGLFVLTYAVTRAVRVPLTYDEAASYIRYIDTTVPSVFDVNAFSIFNAEVATNHLLNTVLTKICWLLGGGRALLLRLPNLLACAVYLACSWRLLRRCVNPILAVAGFVAIGANPYVLDFFALSRGYGLSLAFLMASLVCVFAVVDRPDRSAAHRRHVARALALACLAVLANLAMLGVYLAIFAVLLAASIYAARRGDESPIESAAPRDGQRGGYAWPLAAAAIAATLVFSQDAGLSATLYRPVVLTLAGIDATDADQVRVVQVDLRGRERRLIHDPGTTTWRAAGVPFRGVRVDVPAADAQRLARIEVIVGGRIFAADPLHSTTWAYQDEADRRVFTAAPSIAVQRSRVAAFRAAINWSGDADYAAALAAHAAGALASLALVALGLGVLGRLAVRWRLIAARDWSGLASAALWLGALAGPPVYLLQRNHELYFGGTSGLFVDTFTSAIERAFYGRSYLTAQVPLVMAAFGILVVICAAVVYLAGRRGSSARTLPAVVILAILVLASIAQSALHAAFGAHYLSERTALFYIPLAVLFAAFSCDALASLGAMHRFVAITVSACAVLLSTLHFFGSMNTTSTLDWRSDASTRRMMADVHELASGTSRSGSALVLAVEPRYAPVAEYYARMTAAPDVAVVPPTFGGADFWYGSEADATGRLRVIRRYPATATALARPGAAP